MAKHCIQALDCLIMGYYGRFNRCDRILYQLLMVLEHRIGKISEHIVGTWDISIYAAIISAKDYARCIQKLALVDICDNVSMPSFKKISQIVLCHIFDCLIFGNITIVPGCVILPISIFKIQNIKIVIEKIKELCNDLFRSFLIFKVAAFGNAGLQY